MYAHCSGPCKLGPLSLGYRSACGVFLLLAVFACCGDAPGAQQPSSSTTPAAKADAASRPASQAAAASAAAADRSDEDTLNTTPPGELNDDGNPADKQVAPIVVTAPRLPGSDNAAAAEPVLAAPVPANAGGDARRQQINDQCASLFMLANMLKADVDKTTKDELSVSVVRKAGEIEQLARKVRDEMKPVLSTRNSGGRP